MIVQMQQAYHVAQAALGLIGLGTVVRAIPKGVQWLHKRWQKSLENKVLSTFYDMDDGPWQSANGVVGELYLKAAFSDKWGFLPTKLTGWRAHLHWVKMAPYRWRHAFRAALLLPGKEKADKVLRDLWERGLLIRAGWDHTKNQYYRLKN